MQPSVDDGSPLGGYQALPVVAGRGLPIDEPGAGSGEARAALLSRYAAHVAERTAHHLGYPYNLGEDYAELGFLSQYSINNLGDPFIESNYGVHSRDFEVAVLEWFADLWRLPRAEMWGYITACGTEGNLHGLLLGREVLQPFGEPVLVASRESHYSVFKAARMYRMPVAAVATQPSGELDYDDLLRTLQALRADHGGVDKGNGECSQVVLNLNIGTTVRGAVDDVDRALAALAEAGFAPHTEGGGGPRFYVHCDGALFGLVLPLLGGAAAGALDFRKPIGSISVSGHKFIGAPMPCGVVLSRLRDVAALSSDVEYLASRDATILGSRNGHAPIYMWYALSRKGRDGLRADVERCVANARALRDMLRAAGVPRVALNELSCTVVFARPRDAALVRRWQLACQGDVAHVVVMPSVSLETLTTFAAALGADAAATAPE